MTSRNEDIFLASSILYANKAILWGDNNVCFTPVEKFKLISDAMDYALLQYEKDPQNYRASVKTLMGKLDVLRNDCPEICEHKIQFS